MSIPFREYECLTIIDRGDARSVCLNEHVVVELCEPCGIAELPRSLTREVYYALDTALLSRAADPATSPHRSTSQHRQEQHEYR